MKANETKFETLPTPVPALESGAMIRKGKTGAAREDGMTDQIAAELRTFGSKIIPISAESCAGSTKAARSPGVAQGPKVAVALLPSGLPPTERAENAAGPDGGSPID